MPCTLTRETLENIRRYGIVRGDKDALVDQAILALEYENNALRRIAKEETVNSALRLSRDLLIRWQNKYGKWSVTAPILMTNRLPHGQVYTLELIDAALAQDKETK